MKYFYEARTKEGRIQTGTVETSSRKNALNILEKYGLYVTSLKSETEISVLKRKISFHRRVSQKDLVFFTRQLAVMLKAGIPATEALTAQVTQVENPLFKEQLLKATESVKAGSLLSQAFSLFPEVFNDFYISVIKSGEATGRIADSLDYLANHLETEYELRSKIISALIYPAFVVVVFIAVFFLAAFFIIPKLSSVLKSFGSKLPASTLMLISFSNFIQKGGWLAISVITLLLFLTPFALKNTKSTKKFYDKMVLKTPLLGSFMEKMYITRICENLSVLISSGLPITQALSITKDIIDNSVYKDIIAEAEKEVARGEKISDVLAKYPNEFPAFIWQIFSTGEEAGKLDQMLMKAVDFYRKDIERTTNSLTSILEPVLIVFLGGVVGFLAVAIFIPLFNAGLSGGI